MQVMAVSLLLLYTTVIFLWMEVSAARRRVARLKGDVSEYRMRLQSLEKHRQEQAEKDWKYTE